MKIIASEHKPSVLYWLFFPIGIFYMELVVNFYCFRNLLLMGTVYMLLFSVAIGLLTIFTVSFFKGKWRKRMAVIAMLIITGIMMVQSVYYTIFKTFTGFHALEKAGDAISEFWKEAMVGICNSIIPLLFLSIPLVLLCVFWRKMGGDREIPLRMTAVLAVLITVIPIGTTLHILHNTGGVISYRYVYESQESPELSIPRFGILTTTRLELRDLIREDTEELQDEIEDALEDVFPEYEVQEEKPEAQTEEITPETNDPVEQEDAFTYEANIIEIDFDKLMAEEENEEILEMHEYFKNAEPTMKNEYTGMFKGKNLIWIVAESYSSLALDETHTPTLTKMSQEGFVFHNFYNPVWWVSTSDGEYVTLNSLIPESSVWSFSESYDNLQYFSLGNRLGEEGYHTYAYHNHTYTYYDRHLSHPNMGYDYKGVGNGLDVQVQWPESDLEMMEVTTPEYISKDPFHVYYLTVSGHMNYNFYGNVMAAKHEEEVADLPYSEGPRAYIACNIEFDQAVSKLIEDLEAAGELEDTVIVISGDHYPYGLTEDEILELNPHALDDSFELYRSSLIIWNSEMETVEVDKYCSSLDILPTLSNLFGVNYDSRLMMGKDILSDSEPLIMFKDMSFISTYGRYDSSSDTFTPNEGVSLSENYAADVFRVVQDKFEYSRRILNEDYYRILFEEGEE